MQTCENPLTPDIPSEEEKLVVNTNVSFYTPPPFSNIVSDFSNQNGSVPTFQSQTAEQNPNLTIVTPSIPRHPTTNIFIPQRTSVHRPATDRSRNCACPDWVGRLCCILIIIILYIAVANGSGGGGSSSGTYRWVPGRGYVPNETIRPEHEPIIP